MNRTRSQETARRRPNFLVMLVDEERYPPVYENPGIRQWRERQFVAHSRLAGNSLVFHRHYIGSAACCPSRATLFTGQYPSLHGVSQTNGIAKQAFDSDMFWLNRHTVPTMGHYFREAGYQTLYKGKWHISYEDIVVPGTHRSIPSYHPVTGFPDIAEEQLYRNANPLDDFGFSGWIGPEPHGKNPRNSASSAAIGVSGRDVVYAAEAVQLLEALDRQQNADPESKPWLMTVSFVNPHDIVLYGSLTAHLPIFRFGVEPMPAVDPPPTADESLHTKPRCQASYRDTYPVALQPIIDEPFYRKLYYQLQKNADVQMNRVLDQLIHSSMYNDTIILFTSDHGDLLGAHGHLHQKFYCAYEEMLHVPFMIHSPKLFPIQRNVNAMTSHLDLLPTMLGLAGIDAGEVQQRLAGRFSEVRPFPGRNLTPYVYGERPFEQLDDPVYFMTNDDVTKGQHQVNPLGIPYHSVIQPNAIETVIADLPGQAGRQTWKYSRYFDAEEQGLYPDEFEMYCLTDDPLEIRNLTDPAFATPETDSMRRRMAALLDEQRKQKRLTPSRSGIA